MKPSAVQGHAQYLDHNTEGLDFLQTMACKGM